ncbi:hydrolase 76 protein [Cadophora gregata]|uniref:hydrolase 76 protein n=1 Tax=Cadophora gregata TaxID=51156 RepID=UPI0026DB2863|nr:hydrolase 76 protein [Cadophora gregata]KAK0118581.1 hydrolase 76 protein [Cadophora gregata f. sp. sojae]KAK0125836.1 hydrolase 76 protein [Cadophora gregata]
MVRANTLAALAALSLVSVHGLELVVKSDDSIKSTSSSIASILVGYYNGNEAGETPGLLPEPYFWWNAGAMWDTLIQYWQTTGDDRYNGIVSQALQFQRGDRNDFMPANQTKSLGNDDQVTWALAAMSATEQNFPAPEDTTWFALADAVFNEQAVRWDTESCGGGLRWQIFSFNAGYNYKNGISNGAFFQLASRLARYTGNVTYSDWASKVYEWTTTVGLIDDEYNVFDGADSTQNCSTINKVQFSYVAGTYISGAAHLYNISSGEDQKIWKTVLDGLLKKNIEVFFPDGIATEVSCEESGTCNTDMLFMKGIFAQNLVDTIKVAPYTSDDILKVMSSSAKAVASACSSTGCSPVWPSTVTESDDGGVGPALSALSFVQGLLVGKAAAPVTKATGGAGSNSTGTATGGSGTSTNASESGNPSSSGTPAPTTTGNAAVALGSKMGMGGVAAIMGSAAWLML